MKDSNSGKMKVLMFGTALSVKGGMSSVARNYIDNTGLTGYDIKYIPTYVYSTKPIQILYFIIHYFQIVALLITRQYKIVHLHMTKGGSTIRKGLIAFTSNLLGIKYIIHLHTNYDDYYKRYPGIFRKFVKWIFKNADYNIALSEDMGSFISEIVPESKITVIGNGVKIPSLNPYNPENKNVLFFSVFEKGKGIFDLLRCIKLLDSRISPDIKFHICGAGEEEDAIRKEIESLGIKHRIGRFGWVDNLDKESVFMDTGIHVLPSYNEGLPMSVIETMAYGIPNISTNIPGMSSVIKDKESGFLIDPGDIEALSNRIEMLINDEGLRRKFSDNSYKFVKANNSIEKMMAKTKAIYDIIHAKIRKS